MTAPPTAARLSSPPGSRLTGHLPAFASDPLAFLIGAARAHGPVVPLRFGRTRVYLLSDPSLIEEVLVAKRRSFIKSKAYRAQRPLLGNGLFLSEGDTWLRQRRLAQPAFHPERIVSYAPIVITDTQRMLDSWSEGDTRDVHAEMMRLTVGIIAKILFGADVADSLERVGAALDAAMQRHAGRRGLARLLPEWIPLGAQRRYRQRIREVDEAIFEIIRRRRGSDDHAGDLLSMLLASRDEEGDNTGMSDEQLRDEMMTLLFAGHETTANALTWAWVLLARHPEIEARLAEEVRTLLGGRLATGGDVRRLRYTEAVVQETMRLYPPVWVMSREAVEDVIIGGYGIPAGAVVLMSQWVIHRDPARFDSPETFRPERWTDGSLGDLPRFAYFPFGGGPRVCIGASFAMTEAVLALATITQRFRFLLGPETVITPWPTITLRPRGEVPCLVRRR
jgi:cytochrome P450